MLFLYANKTFIKLQDHGFPREELLRKHPTALFYDEQKKDWSNKVNGAFPTEPLEPKIKLELVKNENEFHEKKWILAKKNVDNQFLQEGPYSSFEIFEMISNSIVRMTDPIWTDGFPRWLGIKEVATFKGLFNSPSVEESDICDILDNIVEYDPGRRVEDKKW